MNDILRIKGQFGHNSRKGRRGPAHLPTNSYVDSAKLSILISNLEKLAAYWKNNTTLNGDTLINVEYSRIVAKSNRIKRLLCDGSYKNDDQVVGAKFNNTTDSIHHIITYHIPYKGILNSISELKIINEIVNIKFSGRINSKTLDEINTSKNWDAPVSKSVFVDLIVDCFYVTSLSIPNSNITELDSQIVTIYNTKFDIEKKLQELGININKVDILDDFTVKLNKEQIHQLQSKAPFLIAMSLTDIVKIDPMVNNSILNTSIYSIEPPKNEPIIGVIDTFFDDNVYFRDWVDVDDVFALSNIPIDNEDKIHGTAVDSIIVDGGRINPALNDGCGNFRVRHFCVATKHGYNSIDIISKLEKIIDNNRDIKVWNFSIGSINETNENYISYEAAELDRLQCKYDDIIFVVAGTNDISKSLKKRIGSPADSINSIVVNAVNGYGEVASYSRKGPVLSFYNKPDISYFGGDSNGLINVCIGTGKAQFSGTSFAAPFIARKVAYLIHIMGLPREIAKAMIIDSAIGWKSNNQLQKSEFMGMGLVPIRIEDILRTKDDEIEFVINEQATSYDNYLYRIPVPISKEKQPYIAKATLCYFCTGKREQGVDYSNTELDLHFGRLTDKGIKTINDNVQNTPISRIMESHARNNYRKWDNVKVICESLKEKGKAKPVYEKGFWGISIKKTERNNVEPESIKFGLVVTLKNINGDNLIQDFIQRCSFNELLVSKLNIEQQIIINTEADTEIEWED